jgi:hypothetical protein
MLITYLIILITAIVFRTFHFPGAGIMFVTTPLFLILDIIIQSVRKREFKTTNILSAVSVLFISLFLTFKFQNWPGGNLYFILATVAICFYLFKFYKIKPQKKLRLYIVSSLFLFSLFNVFISGSSFRMLYMTEDPFNKSEHVPNFFIQSLAFDFYNEGDYAKAETLITRNIEHQKELVKEDEDVQNRRRIES